MNRVSRRHRGRALASILLAMVAGSPALADDAPGTDAARPLGPPRREREPLRVQYRGAAAPDALRARLEVELGTQTVVAGDTCEAPCLLVIIDRHQRATVMYSPATGVP